MHTVYDCTDERSSRANTLPDLVTEPASKSYTTGDTTITVSPQGVFLRQGEGRTSKVLDGNCSNVTIDTGHVRITCPNNRFCVRGSTAPHIESVDGIDVYTLGFPVTKRSGA